MKAYKFVICVSEKTLVIVKWRVQITRNLLLKYVNIITQNSIYSKLWIKQNMYNI